MQRRQALKLLGGGLIGAGFGRAGPAAACGLYPGDAGWRFDVLRHGDLIGDHVFMFSSRGEDFVVEVAIDIAVSLLGITVFRFTHRAEEVWRGGLLQALTTTTDDDGTPWQVAYDRRGDTLQGRVNGTELAAPGTILPASLWHRDTATATALLDTVDGRVKPVSGAVLDGGSGGHYRLTGGIEREVWTGTGCALDRVIFPARDGSQITLRRR